MERQGRWAGRVTRTRPDGTAIVVDVTSMRVRDDDGAVLGIVMVNRDVTGQVRAEEQWRRLGAILDSTSDAVVTVDADDVVMAWNAGAESLFGVPASEAVGSRAHRLVGWEALDDTRGRTALWQDLRAGVEWRGRVRLSTPLGSRIVDCRSMPQLDGEGRLVTVTSVARDVTDRELLVVEREQRHALLQSLAGSLDDAMSDPSASLGPVLESLVAAGTDVAMLWLADAMRESVGLADVRDRDPSWNQRWHETLGATRFALGEGIVGGVVAGGEPYVRLELAAADVRA